MGSAGTPAGTDPAATDLVGAGAASIDAASGTGTEAAASSDASATTPVEGSAPVEDTVGDVAADTAPTEGATPVAADTSATGATPAIGDTATATGATAGTGATDAAAGATTDAAAAPATDAAGTAAAGGAATAGGPLKSDRIQLVDESGKSVTVGVRTPLGKHVVRQFGEDANVWDTEQCVLERGADGVWQIIPGAGTTNETLVNGEPITAARTLNEGDVVGVGRAAKGIVKLPLTVRAA